MKCEFCKKPIGEDEKVLHGKHPETDNDIYCHESCYDETAVIITNVWESIKEMANKAMDAFKPIVNVLTKAKCRECDKAMVDTSSSEYKIHTDFMVDIEGRPCCPDHHPLFHRKDLVKLMEAIDEYSDDDIIKLVSSDEPVDNKDGYEVVAYMNKHGCNIVSIHEVDNHIQSGLIILTDRAKWTNVSPDTVSEVVQKTLGNRYLIDKKSVHWGIGEDRLPTSSTRNTVAIHFKIKIEEDWAW